MTLNERQQKRVAEIIEGRVGWMVGWGASPESEAEAYRRAAEGVAKYLKRLKRRPRR